MNPNSDFQLRISAFALLKYSEMHQAFPVFLPRAIENSLPENSFDLKCMNFRMDFGAKDEVRLTPSEDDKPKDA